MADTDTTKPGTPASVPNPKTGSSDAARGLGSHSKDASHAPGEPAEMPPTEPVKP